MTIFICGGHLTPSLSLIELTRKKHPDWSIIFIGRSQATEEESVESEEKRIISGTGIKFLSISAGRLRPILGLKSVISFIKIPLGVYQAGRYILKYRPNLVISFGGYIGFATVIAAKIFNLPVIMHEQTTVPGFANRLTALISDRICVNYRSAMPYFPENKTYLTGLPIRSEIFNPGDISSFPIPKNRPLIYITGGATGSRFINQLVYKVLGKLLGKYIIVHQVGRYWMKEARQVRSNVRGDKRKNYIPAPYIDTKDHTYLLNRAKFIISRSGANTVGEIAVVAGVSILIPLPISRSNEQFYNAKILAGNGSAYILNQNNAEPADLINLIKKIESDYSTLKINARKYSKEVILNGDRMMLEHIEAVIFKNPENDQKPA